MRGAFAHVSDPSRAILFDSKGQVPSGMVFP